MPYTDYNQVLHDLADNIREANGSTASIRFVDMPDLIGNLDPSISLSGEYSTVQYENSLVKKNSWKRKLIPYADTSGMTDMHNMLKGLDTLNQPLDLKNFDTSNVRNMNHMFEGINTPSIDLSSFNTSKVLDMSYMFSKANVPVDLSNFDTNKVTDMNHMFFEYKLSLSSYSSFLDLSHFDTSNVRNMNRMFQSVRVRKLDLNNWDTHNVTDMSYMFADIYTLRIWVPSTFVATNSSSKPFSVGPLETTYVYTNASSAEAQGWGYIHPVFHIQYNSRYEDFINSN